MEVSEIRLMQHEILQEFASNLQNRARSSLQLAKSCKKFPATCKTFWATWKFLQNQKSTGLAGEPFLKFPNHILLFFLRQESSVEIRSLTTSAFSLKYFFLEPEKIFTTVAQKSWFEKWFTTEYKITFENMALLSTEAIIIAYPELHILRRLFWGRHLVMFDGKH